MFLSFFSKFFVIFTLILYNFHTVSATEQEKCLKTDNKTCNDGKINKYSKEANVEYTKYLTEIERAKAQYLPCNSSNCNCYSAVINDNLRAFKDKGITKDQIDAVKSKGTKYQIIQHKLYRDPNCMFPSRCAGIEHFLLENLESLPDMELIINTRDWPQVPKNYGHFGPVFSFSKTHEYHDIMYPAWAFWEGGPAISLYPRGIGRWDTHRVKLGKVGNMTKWVDKTPKAFFRGSRTSSERDPLVLLSRERADLVDAKYTKNQAWKSEADTLHAPPAQEVSFEDHCNYKYLFNFRGVAASFRLKHILLCKSLVFHVGNEWQEFFYDSLKPWIHYVPVNSNASKEDLRRLIEFAKDHDELMRQIAEEGYTFLWRNLRMKDVGCYWRKLLKNYGGLLRFKVERDEGLVEVRN